MTHYDAWFEALQELLEARACAGGKLSLEAEALYAKRLNILWKNLSDETQEELREYVE